MSHAQLTITLDEEAFAKLKQRAEAKHKQAAELAQAVIDEWLNADESQVWYWTAEWQAAEREAEQDLRSGRFEDFATMDDFISSLNADKPYE